nr:MAG TPA: helix-turn-helix domain protein [Caudoviricetes sp.]
MAKFVSVAQAARRLGVSTETIYNYCRQGLLGGQYIRVNKKGTWRINVESIDLLESDSSFISTRQLKKSLNYSLF